MSFKGSILCGEFQMAIAVNEIYEKGGFWSPYDSFDGRGIFDTISHTPVALHTI